MSWADPSTAALDEYDLLTSAFGAMFFGNRVAAFTNMLRGAAPDEVVSAAVAPLREALAPYADGTSVRLRGAMWLIRATRLPERASPLTSFLVTHESRKWPFAFASFAASRQS